MICTAHATVTPLSTELFPLPGWPWQLPAAGRPRLGKPEPLLSDY